MSRSTSFAAPRPTAPGTHAPRPLLPSAPLVATRVPTPASSRPGQSRGPAVLLAFGLALIGGLAARPAMAEDAAPRAVPDPKAVVELFTSQGCSSCPPADKLLADIAHRPDVIALTLAVDYWDYLGWKDTLAKHGHTIRQKGYARLRGDTKMFTPQVVVNGSGMAVGNDRGALQSAIDAARKPDVEVTLATRGDRLTVAVGAGAGVGEVWLCPVSSRAKVEIMRGENEGTEVVYHNVVRSWVKLGDWTGAPVTFETPLRRAGETDVDSLAVLVQAGTPSEPGPIRGAALQPLPPGAESRLQP